MALTVVDGNGDLALHERPLLAHNPQAVLDEAARAAKALKGVIDQKPEKVVMNGAQYLEFEDWQTVARFYGLTAGEVGEPEFVVLGEAQGFKATSVVRDLAGRELSRATAYCLSDEEKWGSRPKYAYLYETKSGDFVEEDPGYDQIVWIDNPKKPGKKMPSKERRLIGEERVPLFQLASMAQTRANAKALRNVLSWVVVLAGYRSTPAEELDNVADRVPAAPQADGDRPATRPVPAPARQAPAAPAAEPQREASDEQKPPCTNSECNCFGTARAVINSKFPKPGKEFLCFKPKGGCGTTIAAGGAR